MSNTQSWYWDSLFVNPHFIYGSDPGPVARRAEKYHRPFRSPKPTALDLGCGEGQDTVFLALADYFVTGVDFSAQAVRKTDLNLGAHGRTGVHAKLVKAHLAQWCPALTYDLVLSINSLQFVGARADFALSQALRAVEVRGVLGLSVWAREDPASPAIVDGVRLWTREEILAALDTSGEWQKSEVALLWQYSRGEGQLPCEEARPFVTVVAQRLK